MSVVYVTTQGATVQRRSGQLVVFKESNILQNVPETYVEQIVLFGNAHLTTPVVAFCLEKGVDVAFLSVGGNFRGRLHGDLQKVALLRQQQYARSLDAEFRLRQARTIIGGKIANQIAFARRQQNVGNGQNDFALLKRLASSANSIDSVEALMGVEGAAAAAYFRMFARWVPAPFTFATRSAHPPRDAVNALLSLCYTLLYNRIIGLINVVGLDPYQGCLHAHRHGHAALASDLMEEFRPGVCDAFVLKLLKKKSLKPHDIIAEKNELRLRDEAFKIFLNGFEERLNSRRRNPLSADMSLTYRQIIERQIRNYARVIKGELKEYCPFVVK